MQLQSQPLNPISRALHRLLSPHAKLISINASARENGDEIQAIQYLRVIVFRARANASSGNNRADAAISAPVTFPRIVQGATFTCALFRMRLVLPMSLRVITYSLPSSSPNQTGVATAAPVLRKVV